MNAPTTTHRPHRLSRRIGDPAGLDLPIAALAASVISAAAPLPNGSTRLQLSPQVVVSAQAPVTATKVS